MSKTSRCLDALEHRRHFLERKLKTSSLIYKGRSYDEAEFSALAYAIKFITERTEVDNRDKV